MAAKNSVDDKMSVFLSRSLNKIFLPQRIIRARKFAHSPASLFIIHILDRDAMKYYM